MRSLEEIKRLNVKYSKPGQWACPGRSDCLSRPRTDTCVPGAMWRAILMPEPPAGGERR